MDFDAFLQVIDTDKPAGENIRLIAGDLTLDDIAEARRIEDPETSASGTAKSADWKVVQGICESCLLERSKDLEIAGYLLEALCYREGWEGFRDGLTLVGRLIDSFWEHLHPGWDDDEIVLPIRARPISWLGSSHDFLTAVKRIPITAALGQEPFSYFDYEQSKRVDEAGMKTDRAAHDEMVEAGLISGEQWRSALNTTPVDHLAAVKESIAACAEELKWLYGLCEEKFGDDAPYLQDLSNLLDECLTVLAMAPADASATAAGDFDDGSEATMAAGDDNGGAPAPVRQQPVGPIANRDDAYRKLREIADYLRREEPHSPVPALIDRAISWGNMPFTDLFKDVVRDRGTQEQVMEMLGIQHDDDMD